MIITDLIPSFELDSDSNEETIFFTEITGFGFYYFKQKYLSVDFKGNDIIQKDQYIRIRSLWYADLLSRSVREIIPYGKFDINSTYITQRYLYFTKISDRDMDGILGDVDYESGEVCRVDNSTKTLEYCFDIGDYNFHGFEFAGDRYICFSSEDQKPDLTEEIIIDLETREKAIIESSWIDGEEHDYRFITDQYDNPLFVVGKLWVSEGESSSTTNKLWCCPWDDVIKQLNWISQ